MLSKPMVVHSVCYLGADVNEIKFYTLQGKICLNTPGVQQLYPGNERD